MGGLGFMWIEEDEAVRMRCWTLWVGGWTYLLALVLILEPEGLVLNELLGFLRVGFLGRPGLAFGRHGLASLVGCVVVRGWVWVNGMSGCDGWVGGWTDLFVCARARAAADLPVLSLVLLLLLLPVCRGVGGCGVGGVGVVEEARDLFSFSSLDG